MPLASLMPRAMVSKPAALHIYLDTENTELLTHPQPQSTESESLGITLDFSPPIVLSSLASLLLLRQITLFCAK